MKICSANEITPAPKYTFSFKKDVVKEKKYINKIVRYAKKYGTGKHRGELLQFNVADGYASYVVLDDKTLIHLEHLDAYRFALDYRMTLKDALSLGSPLF